jgi:acetolactate synthase-1/2/3 large subunit
MESAVRHDLPVVAIIGNDSAWGIEQHFQRGMYGEGHYVGTSLAPVRYDLLAKAVGGHGERVEQLEELEPALERAFASGKPACVDIAVRQDASPATQGAVARFSQRYRDHLARNGG